NNGNITISGSALTASGNISLTLANGGSFTNNSTITSSAAAGIISVTSGGSLTVTGNGELQDTGGGATSLTLVVTGGNPLTFNGNQLLAPGSSGTVTFNAGSVVLDPGAAENMLSGSALNINTTAITFGAQSIINAVPGASITIAPGSGNPLTLTLPAGGSALIATGTGGILTSFSSSSPPVSSAGTITIGSTTASTVTFQNSGGSTAPAAQLILSAVTVTGLANASTGTITVGYQVVLTGGTPIASSDFKANTFVNHGTVDPPSLEFDVSVLQN